MSGDSAIEACRSPDELRAAYAGAMAKQVAAEPHDLATLRARFRRRGKELREGLGARIEDRPAWVLACIESSLPDEVLEAELLRLHAEDRRLDLGPLREILGARADWKEARADPAVPPVVLHVLARRMGAEPRGRAMAQDVAHPRRVAERIREAYPRLYALDPVMFRQIGGMPTAPSRRVTGERAAPARKSGRVSFWMVVFAIWVVAKLLGLAVKDRNGDPGIVEPEPRGIEAAGEGKTVFGAEYDRLVRRLDEVRELEREVRIAEQETQAVRTMSVVRRQRLRERLGSIRYAVEELVPAKAAMRVDLGYPAIGDLADLNAACQKAAHRLAMERAQLLLERVRSARGAEGDR